MPHIPTVLVANLSWHKLGVNHWQPVNLVGVVHPANLKVLPFPLDAVFVGDLHLSLNVDATDDLAAPDTSFIADFLTLRLHAGGESLVDDGSGRIRRERLDRCAARIIAD